MQAKFRWMTPPHSWSALNRGFAGILIWRADRQTVRPSHEVLRNLTYLQITRTPTYSFLIAVPMLVAYELIILLADAGGGDVRIGPELWLKEALRQIGGTGNLALGATVLIFGLVAFWKDREKCPPLVFKFFPWMLIESAAWAILVGFSLAFAVNHVLQVYPAMIPVMGITDFLKGEVSFTMKFALSLGAGLYEELFFRVLLVGGLAWVISIVVGKDLGYAVAAVIGALLFSLAHYVGPSDLVDDFDLYSFVFRFLFGLAMTGIYLYRGYGIAAWSHAFYDIFVLVFFGN